MPAAPTILKASKINLATLAEFSGEQIQSALKTRLSEIDTALSKSLPYLGALRYFAKVREITLAELVESYGSATRKTFEDSKPYSDILQFFGATAIPSNAFDAITRKQARELAAKFPILKKDTATLEKIQNYLGGPCKFKDGWLEHVMGLIPTLKPIETPPVPTEETTPSLASETPPAPTETPAPAPELDLATYFDELRALTARLPVRLADMARANLARAVNSPAAWADFCKATAPASNVIPMPTTGEEMKKAA